MAGDADEEAGRHRNGQKVGDEAELERAAANENQPDREAERRRGRWRNAAGPAAASTASAPAKIGAMVESAPTERRRLSPKRANPIAPASKRKKADPRREPGEAGRRHLRGNGDRGERHAGDRVGAKVAGTPAGERPQDRTRGG